ncbi:glycine/betaine ABC transporter [Halalkalibacillus sediminis]|uniref:Glycine/betaine ABC transporter n=1 Tax=Halalkalibacillus sediminis TaxID=2018042 RepID=A0A2I0QXW1_9BACI|nr:glycine betaine ABC transporter substrate-binding protein [Halalkalibacillus sediminis]PKR79159.1 glycine/betaine ABC transporter [Halalkalibacillus sediminis]
MKNLKKLFPIILLGILLLLAACGGDDQSGEGESNEGDNEAQEDKGSISIGMNNWAENVAVSNMWKIVLEEKGYDVSLEPVEKAILYEGLKNGDLDIGMEIWLPNTDQAFYEDFKEDIDWREEWYEGTDLALVVPSYVEDVNSIEDLNEHADKFESEIYGIDPGSSIMGLTEDVIADYGLEYELIGSSEPSMLAELQNRIDSEEPIVVTLWKPHWTFSEMDLKILEDPKNIYGDSENISYAARLGLEEDHPEVVEWFDNFMLNDDQLGSLMASLNEADSEQEGAQNWIDENQDLIDEWTGGSE